MFDGVGWAAGEIVIFMLIATLIGLALGWIVGRWLQRGSISGDFESEIDAEKDRADRAEQLASESREELDKAQLELKAEQGKLAELAETADAGRVAAEELEASLGEAAERDGEIDRLTSELAAMTDLETRIEDKSRALEEAEADVERLQAELQEAAAATERSAAQLASLDALEQELAQSRARAADADRLESDIASCEAEREQLTAERDRLQAELEEARFELTEAAAVDGVPAAESVAEDLAVEVPADEPPPAPPVSGKAPTKEQGIAQISEIAARTAGDGPVADDDLKKVRGIGPKLERTLKDLGITSFRQIANFQPRDIVFVTAALDAFRGRIERDDWMSSAAEEHTKKYGEPA